MKLLKTFFVVLFIIYFSCYAEELGKLYRQAKFKEILAISNSILEKEPNNIENYFYIINSAIILKKYDCAKDIYKKGMRKNPQNGKLIINYYRFLKKFYPKESEKFFLKFKERKNHPFYYYIIGKFEIINKNYDKALDYFYKSYAKEEKIFESATQILLIHKNKKEKDKLNHFFIKVISDQKIKGKKLRDFINFYIDNIGILDNKVILDIVTSFSNSANDYVQIRNFFVNFRILLVSGGYFQDFCNYVFNLPTERKYLPAKCFIAFCLENDGKIEKAKEIFFSFDENDYDLKMKEFMISFLLKNYPLEGEKAIIKLVEKYNLPRHKIVLAKIYYKKKEYTKVIDLLKDVSFDDLNEDLLKSFVMLKILSYAHIRDFRDIRIFYSHLPFTNFEDFWYIANEVNKILEITPNHKALLEEIKNEKSPRFFILRANTYRELLNPRGIVTNLISYLKLVPYQYKAKRYIADISFKYGMIFDPHEEKYILKDKELLEIGYPYIEELAKNKNFVDLSIVRKYLIVGRYLDKYDENKIYTYLQNIDNPDYILHWAIAASDVRFFTLSERLFDRLLKDFKLSSPEIMHNYAIFLTRKGDYEKALSIYKNILLKGYNGRSYQPDDVFSNYMWCLTTYLQDESKVIKRLKNFYKLVEKTPKVPDKENIMDYILNAMVKHKGLNEALSLAKDTLHEKIGKNKTTIYFFLANTLYKNGKFEESLKYLKLMQNLNLSSEKEAELLINMGKIYEKLGMYKKAFISFKILSQKYPYDPLSIDALYLGYKLAKKINNGKELVYFKRELLKKKRLPQQILKEITNESEK